MPNRQTVCLQNITRPEWRRGAGQVQSPSRYSAGYPRVSNGTPRSRCRSVRLSTYREEAAPMRSQPLPGEASRRRAEEQFKTTKKVNSETKANTPSRQAEAAKTARLRALRLAKEAADKDTANRAAAAAKAGDLSGAGAFEDLRPQPQNTSKARLRVLHDGCGV